MCNGGLASELMSNISKKNAVMRAASLAEEKARVRRQLKDAQDMLTGALNEGEPQKLHMTAHAVRDNLRTALAQLDRETHAENEQRKTRVAMAMLHPNSAKAFLG